MMLIIYIHMCAVIGVMFRIIIGNIITGKQTMTTTWLGWHM